MEKYDKYRKYPDGYWVLRGNSPNKLIPEFIKKNRKLKLEQLEKLGKKKL